MKILVIDDHPLIVDALAQLLPQVDATVEVRGAIDPAEADAVLDNEPDVALVLLDLALPGRARAGFPRRPEARLSRRAGRRAFRDARPRRR